MCKGVITIRTTITSWLMAMVLTASWTTGNLNKANTEDFLVTSLVSMATLFLASVFGSGYKNKTVTIAARIYKKEDNPQIPASVWKKLLAQGHKSGPKIPPIAEAKTTRPIIRARLLVSYICPAAYRLKSPEA